VWSVWVEMRLLKCGWWKAWYERLNRRRRGARSQEVADRVVYHLTSHARGFTDWAKNGWTLGR